jgi:hypothetical protein
MEIIVEDSRQNDKYLMRKCGYMPWRNPRSGETSYIRKLGGGYYPRFHIKVRKMGSRLIFDLHLDSRRPMHKIGIRTYEDEESRIVSSEADRIKKFI